MLERLVYRSKATHKLGSLHLFNLLVERHHNVELLARGPITDRQFADWAMAFSSYAHFDKYDIPGFFPVDAQGMSRAAERCAQWASAQFSDEKAETTL